MKPIYKNILLLLVSVIVTLGILEIALRIYNPFEFRVKGDRIVLKAYKKNSIHTVKKNEKNDKLDPYITNTRNSLGFRGEEPPADFGRSLTVIAVGGSTTECLLLTDGKDWPAQLGEQLKARFDNVWVNNAGLDGHSSFGHYVLMEDYIVKIKPRVVLFLVGLNDIGLDRIREHDTRSMEEGISLSSAKEFFRSLADHSELINFGKNIDRFLRARARELDHHQVDFAGIPAADNLSGGGEVLAEHKARYIPLYEKRLTDLIEISRANGIEPVFATQPVVYGAGVDDVTRLNLETMAVSGSNGKLQWRIMELYNDATRETGRKRNVTVIDLARLMPKSTRYYYDFTHYTNDGAREVAKILADGLSPVLKRQQKQAGT